MSHGDDAATGPGLRTVTFAVECPGCRAHLAASRRLAGGPAVCPTCRAEFLLPAAATAGTIDAPVVFAEPPLPSTRRRPDDAFVVIEADAVAFDSSPFAFHEPVRQVAGAGTAVELRRPSPRERRRRHAQRNVVILAVGAALLAALAVTLAARGR